MKANIIKTQQYLYVKLTHRQHVLIRHKHLKLLIADIQTELKFLFTTGSSIFRV